MKKKQEGKWAQSKDGNVTNIRGTVMPHERRMKSKLLSKRVWELGSDSKGEA